ncbi:MAG: DUF4230 domain-containing protein [Candidatus Sericytochromatia bacterium]
MTSLYLVLNYISKSIDEKVDKAKDIPSDTIISVYDSVKYIAKDISSYLNFTPKISVNNIAVVKKELPILELATLELKDVKYSYSWSDKWLNSEKKININGNFDIKFGFDLNKSFEINIDETKKEISLTLPQPKILSIELKRSSLESEDGWINKINDNDRNIVLNSFITSAKKEFNKEVYFEKSRKNLENVFNKVLTKRLEDFNIKYIEDKL